jgi:hypothetical protein
MSTSTRTARPTVRLPERLSVIAVALVVALAVNLALYRIGRAAGGTFTYVQSGKRSAVDAVAVSIMSVGPLAFGLALLAWLAPRRPGLIRAAKIVVPVLALATIALMTVPAQFDTCSTVFLSCMHVALIPISLLAIVSLDRAGHGQPNRKEQGMTKTDRE